MRPSWFLTLLFLTSTATSSSSPGGNALQPREADGSSTLLSNLLSPDHTLEKRKGGGGKGGGGGGGGKGGGGGGGRGSPTSNSGGATRQGSGAARSYGNYYGGGSKVPYTAGSRSYGGLLPGVLLGAGVAVLLLPGIWAYSVWPYYYNNPYRFYNASFQNATQQGLNETLPVVCLCQEYAVCGCDENTDQAYIDALIGNGSYAALNKTLVNVAEVNDTRTLALVLNGSLPNGTTAPGGDEDANAAAGNALPFGRLTGYYVLGCMALYAVILL